VFIIETSIIECDLALGGDPDNGPSYEDLYTSFQPVGTFAAIPPFTPMSKNPLNVGYRAKRLEVLHDVAVIATLSLHLLAPFSAFQLPPKQPHLHEDHDASERE